MLAFIAEDGKVGAQAKVLRFTNHWKEQVSYDGVAHADQLTEDLVGPINDMVGDFDHDFPSCKIETASQVMLWKFSQC